MVEEGLVPAKPKNEYMLLGEEWWRSEDGDYVGKEIRSSGKADVSRVGGGCLWSEEESTGSHRDCHSTDKRKVG